MLNPHVVFERKRIPRSEDLVKARDPRRFDAFRGVVEHRSALIARRVDVVVGGGDVSALWIELSREVAPEPAPFELASAGHGQAPIPAVPVGREPRHLEGDVTLDVSADEAVGGAPAQCIARSKKSVQLSA